MYKPIILNAPIKRVEMQPFMKFFIVLLFLAGSFIDTFAQEVDHWETIIYNDDQWRYAIGSSDIPLEWIDQDYEIEQWNLGQGGFGYGDDDDNTILNDVLSVFIRKDFNIESKSLLSALLLHADYDDGFVAYLNGVEIARKNLGVQGVRPPYNETAINTVEPKLAQNQIPDAFQLDLDLLNEGTNVLAIQVHNRDDNSSDLSSNFFLSAGIANETVIYGSPPDWFANSLFSSSLPIIKITTPPGQEIMDEPRITAQMGVIFNGEGNSNSVFDPFNDYDGAIAIELRGTSSLGFDKKGYGFETRNEDGSNNNVSLIGMPEENDWVLNGPYSDKSLLRNVITYHLGNLSGRYAPRTRLCELFIDNEYLGVYVLTEKIKQDKNRVDIAKLTEVDNFGDELTGGYIIKIDRNDENIAGAGWYSSYPDNKFIAYVDPKDDQITDLQKEYIQDYVYNFESAMWEQNYLDVYQDYVDEKSFVDYFLVTEIGKHVDAFKLSFYLFKDKNSNGGKLNFGPLWDFNLGYGNFDFGYSPDPDGWSYEFPDQGSWHPFWAKKLAESPNIQNLSDCRWTELREGPFQTDSIMQFIDEKVALMGSAVDRNFERWQILGEYVWPNDYVGETYMDEIDFLKNWLQERLVWMDQNMVGNCDEYIPVATKEIKELFVEVFPNPARSHFNVLWGENEPVTLEIYDMESRLLDSRVINAQSNAQIFTDELNNGVYVLIFKSTDNQSILATKKLVVVR